MFKLRSGLAAVALALLAAPAVGGIADSPLPVLPALTRLTPLQKCESVIELLSGSFLQCRFKAEAAFIKTSDAMKLAKNLTKCSDTFTSKFNALITKFACSATEPAAAFENALTECTETVANAAAGGTFPACGDNVINAAGEHCDSSDFGGASCASLGFASGILACTPGCKFDTSSCDALGTMQFTLTLTENGGSIMCAVAGGAAGPCAASYASGTMIMLLATPDANHVTGTWSSTDNVCTGTTAVDCTVTMSQNRTVTATFNPGPISITVGVNGNGTTSCHDTSTASTQTPCAATYPFGHSVLITATPTVTASSHNHVASWDGDCSGSGTGLTCTVTMNGPQSTTVTIDIDLVTLTVMVVGLTGGTGSVSDGSGFICASGTCMHDYPYNSTFTLTPTPAVASSFMGWTGGGCNGTGNCIFTNFRNAAAITATFKTP